MQEPLFVGFDVTAVCWVTRGWLVAFGYATLVVFGCTVVSAPGSAALSLLFADGSHYKMGPHEVKPGGTPRMQYPTTTTT